MDFKKELTMNTSLTYFYSFLGLFLISLNFQTASIGAERNNYNLLFSESFSGSDLDPNRWKKSEHTFLCNLAKFTPTHVAVNNQTVKLLTTHSPLGKSQFSSAEITTLPNKDGKFLYGRFENRMKVSKVSGIVSAFFLYRYNPWQEIDIEFLGKDTTKIQTNIFFNPGKDGDKINGKDAPYGHPKTFDLGFDAGDDFHTYAIEWDKNEVRWYVDDRLLDRRQTALKTPNLPMQLMMNAWPSCSPEWSGPIDANSLDSSFESAGIRVFEK